jgi:hypothetical protein
MTGDSTLHFSSSLLFSLVLFGVALRLGRQAVESSFEATVQTLCARATANLSCAEAELAGIGRRVEGLEQQVAALAERMGRCEEEIERLTATVGGGAAEEEERWVLSL